VTTAAIPVGSAEVVAVAGSVEVWRGWFGSVVWYYYYYHTHSNAITIVVQILHAYMRYNNIIHIVVVGSQSGLHRVLLCGCGLVSGGLVRAGKGISARDPAAAALMSSIWFLMVAARPVRLSRIINILLYYFFIPYRHKHVYIYIIMTMIYFIIRTVYTPRFTLLCSPI